MENIFAERMKKLRIERDLTQEEVGKVIGVSKSTIGKYELGNCQNMKQTAIKKLADFFGVSPAYLFGMTDERTDYPSNLRQVKTKRFPMLVQIACGKPIYAEEDHEAYIDASADIHADFCLTAKGDSMTGARINDGDVVFISTMAEVQNGDICAVQIGDDATLKRWYFTADEGKLVLVAENPAYTPLVFIGKELEKVKCLGKAVCFMSNL